MPGTLSLFWQYSMAGRLRGRKVVAFIYCSVIAWHPVSVLILNPGSILVAGGGEFAWYTGSLFVPNSRAMVGVLVDGICLVPCLSIHSDF